jgi:putative ABC transport system permease protein
MNQFSFAYRNLIRNWRRSLTTSLAITIGMMMLLLFGGYTRAILLTLETGIVGKTGHLHIVHEDYGNYGFGDTVRYGIGNADQVMRGLMQVPEIRSEVRVMTPSLLFSGLASRYDAGSARMMAGEGVLPADQRMMRTWNAYGLKRKDSEFPLPEAPLDSAVIGSGLGRALGLCRQLGIGDCPPPAPVLKTSTQGGGGELPADLAALSERERRTQDPKDGSKIDLLTSSQNGAPNAVSVNVVAAQNQIVRAFDATYVALNLARARQLVFGAEAAAQSTFVLVQLHSTQSMASTKQRINARLRELGLPLVAVDFIQFEEEYNQIQSMFDTIFGFMSLMMGTVVLFTVANTMSASVLERTVEIGTLRAIGNRAATVRSMFLIEGSMLGIAGVISGGVLALLISFAINNAGLTWIPPGRALPVPLAVSLWGSWLLMAFSGLLLLTMSVVSAWIPARRAARKPIVEALRHV